MAARRLLEKLGEAALKPQFVNGSWRKPAISLRIQAKLRKENLLEGRDWFGDTGEAITPPPRRTPKGHKWERDLKIRKAEIEENMKTMPEKIAAHRESRRMKESSLFDMLTLSAQQRRVKQRG
mmetsp:Transcript_20227/g.60968  ORF Transcript_20227/g.60968 Transcript_20227/m.60968 type:complete len:123 (+) Transcript_20227:201-569(+)